MEISCHGSVTPPGDPSLKCGISTAPLRITNVYRWEPSRTLCLSGKAPHEDTKAHRTVPLPSAFVLKVILVTDTKIYAVITASNAPRSSVLLSCQQTRRRGGSALTPPPAFGFAVPAGPDRIAQDRRVYTVSRRDRAQTLYKDYRRSL